MITLTAASSLTRKSINFTVIAVIALIFLKFSLSLALAYWKAAHPPPPAPPTVAFGKLSRIDFTANNNQGLTASISAYKIETVGNVLPPTPDTGKIYFMPHTPPNLLALERATELAHKMNFGSEAIPVAGNKNQYKFLDLKNFQHQLIIDTTNNNFSIKNSYVEEEISPLPPKEKIIETAKNFLSSYGFNKEDLLNGNFQVVPLIYQDGDFNEVPSLAEANASRIIFSRGLLDEYPIVNSANLVYLLQTNNTDPGKRIIEANYIYYPIDKQTSATYPLKTASLAYEELKAGKGFLNKFTAPQDSVVIRKVYLAYFDSEKPQPYLQLIFVFEGDGGFQAFVPAVTSEWVQ